MKTIFTVFYLWNASSFDDLVAKVRASTITSIVLTCNTFIFLAALNFLIEMDKPILIPYRVVVLTGIIYIFLVLFLIDPKDAITKSQKIIVWLFSILSIIGFALVLGETNLILFPQK